MYRAEELVDRRARARCNESMLGRLQRTTRVDVGFALSFAGMSYLVWALVAGTSRDLVKEVIHNSSGAPLPSLTNAVRIFFVDAGIAIDIAGLAWLVASLVLVLLSSRQRVSISWAWLCAICQSMIAAAGSTVVGWAAYLPHVRPIRPADPVLSPWQQVTGLSLPVVMAVAVVVWVTFLVWLLVERARLDRHGPTLRDGLRTNIYR